MKKFDACFIAGPFFCKVWPGPTGLHVVRLEVIGSDSFNQMEVYLINQKNLRDAMVQIAETLYPFGVSAVRAHYAQIEGV